MDRWSGQTGGDDEIATRGACRHHLGDLRRRPAHVGSEVAARHNDDGTISFVSIDPGLRGLEFVVGGPAENRTLTIRDGQHTYVFTRDAS
jgi:hypothetical protein